MSSSRLLNPCGLFLLMALCPTATWSAFDDTPDWSTDGDTAGMLFGGVVSTAGDVNEPATSTAWVQEGAAANCNLARPSTMPATSMPTAATNGS